MPNIENPNHVHVFSLFQNTRETKIPICTRWACAAPPKACARQRMGRECKMCAHKACVSCADCMCVPSLQVTRKELQRPHVHKTETLAKFGASESDARHNRPRTATTAPTATEESQGTTNSAFWTMVFLVNCAHGIYFVFGYPRPNTSAPICSSACATQ